MCWTVLVTKAEYLHLTDLYSNRSGCFCSLHTTENPQFVDGTKVSFEFCFVRELVFRLSRGHDTL